MNVTAQNSYLLLTRSTRTTTPFAICCSSCFVYSAARVEITHPMPKPYQFEMSVAEIYFHNDRAASVLATVEII